MADEYRYGMLEDQLIELFSNGAPDFTAAEKLIEQGADLNATGDDEEENLLSEILEGYWYSACDGELIGECENCVRSACDDCAHNKNPNLGESMVQIIRFFLDHGFDVHKKNERYGAQCLWALVLSTFDVHILTATKLLLDAGAKNVSIYETGDDDETPWSFIATEGSYQDICCYDHHLGNVYEAVYQVYQAVDEGRPYAGIDTYMAVLGKRVVRVLAEKPAAGAVFFDLKLRRSRHRNCYRQNLYFMYDGGMLITTRFADMWTDTVLPEKPLVDVSDTFPGVVGSSVSKVSFGHNEIVDDTTHYGQPVIVVEMESGVKLTMSINFGEVKEEDKRVAYFTLQPEGGGNICRCIWARSQRIHRIQAWLRRCFRR